ncbi:hypothetical protein CEUSTIGMA_g11712.t1 [Chlamydomonas eustigma]|uniref:Uncharacterized protein n=1 Tax=Chlamydomonas eustigma TaxID=1157962 RepID=A0A250XNA5_9CHLO|nr:hypothetical protein CEUSTIGMA_g11712.t1 [Chlamydomonas eustigma]|eukprot:GAX84290.1 hypothetical protein CEUSTIGMA_g11712.t1 [Chlamydomonas eustigma]
MVTTLAETSFGKCAAFGTMERSNLSGSTSKKLSGRSSLISSWRSPAVGRAFYDNCQSHELDVKLRMPNVGPRLLPYLESWDANQSGLCSKQHLLKMLLLHFNVLLTPGEEACLIAEWQVMDHFTGEVDYKSLCALATSE